MAKSEQPGGARISLDDAAQDLFGLNIKGLKSIWALWIWPRRYFRAAGQPDWDGKYTPSIRLWLSLVALMSLLQFIWIGTDTPLVSVYAQGFRDAGIALTEGLTYEELGERTALWVHGITPIFQAVFLVFLALIYPFWGQRTSFAQRLRYIFATVIPGATLMLFILPTMRLMSIEMVSYFGFVIGIIAWLADFTTSSRGGFAEKQLRGRLWRGALLATVILTFNFVAAIVVQIAGIVLVNYRYGLSVG